jgi:hypothetical protein
LEVVSGSQVITPQGIEGIEMGGIGYELSDEESGIGVEEESSEVLFRSHVGDVHQLVQIFFLFLICKKKFGGVL